jgi:hypothetical protein
MCARPDALPRRISTRTVFAECFAINQFIRDRLGKVGVAKY